MELLYIIGFVIYLVYSVVSAGKKAQNKGKTKRPIQRPRQRSSQLPEQGQQHRTRPQNKTGGQKSLEEMLQEIYQETNTPNPAPVQQPSPPEKVFTYDDDPSYNEKPESYDEHAHDREAQYEGEAYEKRKQKEMADIIYRRKNKIHLSGTMKAQKRVKKEVKIRDFNFNARDAIIYDIIMKRPNF